MADQRIDWRFCPRCALPWPKFRLESIRGKSITCPNCEERIPDIDGWMEDCRMYREKVERLTEWLVLIDGGDVPFANAALLRSFAFKALRGDTANE